MGSGPLNPPSDNDDNDDGIIFEFEKNIQNVSDIIIMFLENNKKSCGGDIKEYRFLNNKPVSLGENRSLKVIYHNTEIVKSLTDKTFLDFQDYTIRASRKGYRNNNQYKTNCNQIILSDINTLEEPYIVQLYGEYLNPDNDLLKVEEYLSMKNTFLLTYKDRINREHLKKSFEKRNTIRNKELSLFECFETNAVLIEMNKNKEIKLEALNELIKSMLNQQKTTPLVNSVGSGGKKFFIDFNDKHNIIIQFENSIEVDSNQFISSMFDFINRKTAGSIEYINYIHNFKVVSSKLLEKAKEIKLKSELEKTINNLKIEKETPLKLPGETTKAPLNSLRSELSPTNIFNPNDSDLDDSDYSGSDAIAQATSDSSSLGLRNDYFIPETFIPQQTEDER
jgi:hypothetical protein